jgi:hypothetical protein
MVGTYPAWPVRDAQRLLPRAAAVGGDPGSAAAAQERAHRESSQSHPSPVLDGTSHNSCLGAGRQLTIVRNRHAC